MKTANLENLSLADLDNLLLVLTTTKVKPTPTMAATLEKVTGQIRDAQENIVAHMTIRAKFNG